jgi:hypothetical protein
MRVTAIIGALDAYHWAKRARSSSGSIAGVTLKSQIENPKSLVLFLSDCEAGAFSGRLEHG